MQRLPQPGSDGGQWGNILNGYLLVSHADDGKLRADTVGAPQIKPQSVTNSALAAGAITEEKLHTDVQAKLNAASVTSVAGKTGVVTLSKNDVGLNSVDNTSDVDKPISNATQAALNTKQAAGQYVTESQLSNTLNDTVTTAVPAAVETELGTKNVPSFESLPDDSYQVRFDDGQPFLQADEDRGIFSKITHLDDSVSMDAATFTKELTDDMGWKWAFIYQDGEIAMGERTNGQLYPTHLNPGSVTPTTLTAVTIHGDSLTANWAGNVASLATSLGRTVTARGNGGHTSKLIAARQGGQPMLVNVTGGSIPASGSVDVTLAFAAGVGTTGATSMPSAVGSYVGVLGNVAGTLAITSEGVGTFTRTTSGVATVISNGTPFTTGYSWRKALPIFWAGRNNFKLSGDATQIVSDIRAMMAWTQRADRALILSIPPWVGEENGTGVRNTLNSVNNAIRDAFPTAYVDTASMLRDQALIVEVGGTPTATDIDNIANGLTPESFRSDAGHLNALGYSALNKLISRTYAARGWMED